MGATLHRGARASHYRGLSCCRAQAPDAQAQQLWLTGVVAPRHVGSSQTRSRTRVPCIGRQILNHCTTREALLYVFKCTPLGWSHSATSVSPHKLSSMGCPCAAGHGPCFLGHLVLSRVTNGYRYMFSQQFILYQSLEKTHGVGLENICRTLLSILT